MTMNGKYIYSQNWSIKRKQNIFLKKPGGEHILDLLEYSYYFSQKSICHVISRMSLDI